MVLSWKVGSWKRGVSLQENVNLWHVHSWVPYLFELPDETGRSDFLITRAVPHSDGGLSFQYFGTQLCHRVETDLLLRCVFKVLERERERYLAIFLHLQLKCISLTQACIHTFLWKEAETKRLKLFLLLSSATSVFCLESQLVQFGIFFSYPLGLQDVLLCCGATAINALYVASASVSRDLISKDGALALSIKQTWAQTRLFPSGVISTTWPGGTKDATLPVLPFKRRVR